MKSKMKKLILFISIILLSLSLNAQYAFKVLAAKGSNQVLTSGVWNNVSAGTKVNTGEKLKLIEGGYLGLIHNSGKTIELKSSGTFNVDSLEFKVITGKSNFGSKYSKFVADGMFNANKNAKKNYDRIGAVHRGFTPSIIIYAPKKTLALKSKPLNLHWNNCGVNHTYTLILTDFFGQIVYTKQTDTNYISIDFNDMKISSDDEMYENLKKSYLVTIQSNIDSKKYTSSDDENTYNYEIQLIDDDKETELIYTLNNLKKQIDRNSALDQMILASFYEKQGLMTYAVSSYLNAIKLQPDVYDFQKQYEEYIKVKLGLDSLKGKFD